MAASVGGRVGRGAVVVGASVVGGSVGETVGTSVWVDEPLSCVNPLS